jgi:hypothetical protein
MTVVRSAVESQSIVRKTSKRSYVRKGGRNFAAVATNYQLTVA